MATSLRLALVALALSGCGTENRQAAAELDAVEQGTMVKTAALPSTFGLGTVPSAARIAAVNIDANASGAGLPAGSGSYQEGARLYKQKCAACHGAKGEGAGMYPQLIGVEHVEDFTFGNDPRIPKTIGNYWPYATTLYDYIHRAMPYTAPGSLRPDEVYSLVAYLLAENRIVPRDAVIDAQTLPKIRMPARLHFVPDDRKGGGSFR
jgi:cytochrome c